jgi:2-keto-4-pentenoate hydratase/2-oxohepta-3-ene-1,7-dioic acid hydratase in catechol pathway
MKLVSFLHDARASFGLIDGDRIIDLGQHDPSITSLREALARDALPALAAQAGAPELSLLDVTLLPVIPDPTAVFCVGLNYKSHAEEAEKTADAPFPLLFFRLRESIVAHGAPLICPAVSTAYDFEGELAVIIGKAGSRIAEADAMDHVAGYTCFMDGSARDYQKFSVDAGKNFDDSGALGPWLVTRDEIPDVAALTLSTYVSNERMQHAGLDQLMHGIPALIAMFSNIRRLQPGDVIATGTPSGVGHLRKPPRYLQPGDEVIVDIPGIGALHNMVIAQPQPAF